MGNKISSKRCHRCGEPIPQGRLKAMPKTNVCTTCANELKSQPTVNRIQDYGNCPRCGSKLKLCHGPRVDFVGCSSFPKCTYKLWLSRRIGSTSKRTAG